MDGKHVFGFQSCLGSRSGYALYEASRLKCVERDHKYSIM